MTMAVLFPSESPHLLFFLLASLLSFFSTDAQPLFNTCSTTGNYTANSTYETNLNRLLSSFPSNASLTGFYNATAGDRSDKIYGLVLCRGDVTPTVCRYCVTAGVEDIQQLCPYKKAATVWYDYCLLRYSNLNFFSIDASSSWNNLISTRSVTDPLPFNNVVKDMLNRLAMHAAYESLQMFATEEVNFNVSRPMKVYGLVQCSRDVSRRDCKHCLDVAISQLKSCCDGREGGRVVGTSCNFRYELYSFYNGSTLVTLLSPPLPPLISHIPPPHRSRPPLPPLISHIPPPQPPAGESNKGDSGKRKWLVPVVIISILMAFLLLGTFVYLCKKRGNKHETLLDEDGNNNNADIPFYDFASIMVATDRFSDCNKLGQGGFGAVYKGKLSQGQEIAVKRLSKSSGQGAEEFKNEVMLIAKLQHRNLVRLLGYCISRDEKMLLYEYMPNRSLDFFLFDKTRCEFLDWTRRFVIILGIARGLLYLHQDSRLRIIHRDLKTSNILLDEEMNPKISDFGLARVFEGNQTEESTNRLVGTYGYMSPEYASHGLFSVKSDVFSFGVILIEIITGRKNTSFVHSEDLLTLLGHAWQLWKEGKGMYLMDPSMTETCHKQEFLKCLQVGLLCVEEDATDRPTMATVISLLTSETAMLPAPRKPALFVRSHSKNVSPQNNARNCSNYEVTMSSLEGR